MAAGSAPKARALSFTAQRRKRDRRLVGELEAFDALLRRLPQSTEERSPTPLEIYLFTGPGQFDFGYRDLTSGRPIAY